MYASYRPDCFGVALRVLPQVEMMVAFRPDLSCFGGRPDGVLKNVSLRPCLACSSVPCVCCLLSRLRPLVLDVVSKVLDTWKLRYRASDRPKDRTRFAHHPVSNAWIRRTCDIKLSIYRKIERVLPSFPCIECLDTSNLRYTERSNAFCPPSCIECLD